MLCCAMPPAAVDAAAAMLTLIDAFAVYALFLQKTLPAIFTRLRHRRFV